MMVPQFLSLTQRMIHYQGARRVCEKLTSPVEDGRIKYVDVVAGSAVRWYRERYDNGIARGGGRRS